MKDKTIYIEIINNISCTGDLLQHRKIQKTEKLFCLAFHFLPHWQVAFSKQLYSTLFFSISQTHQFLMPISSFSLSILWKSHPLALPLCTKNKSYSLLFNYESGTDLSPYSIDQLYKVKVEYHCNTCKAFLVFFQPSFCFSYTLGSAILNIPQIYHSEANLSEYSTHIRVDSGSYIVQTCSSPSISAALSE